jgi:hypothetical protein
MQSQKLGEVLGVDSYEFADFDMGKHSAKNPSVNGRPFHLECIRHIRDRQKMFRHHKSA